MKSDETASVNRREPAAATLREEPVAGSCAVPEPDASEGLLECVLERADLQRALQQVRRNRGAPGIDAMSVDELPQYLKEHWMEIRAELVAGRYKPQPVRRVEIPKPDGRKRLLGIPTVLDRFIQQAVAQFVQGQWEPHFHDDRYGYQPVVGAPSDVLAAGRLDAAAADDAFRIGEQHHLQQHRRRKG